MVVGILGSVPFVTADGYVLTFSSFTRSMGEKYEKHEIINSRPVLEWTGTEAASVELSIRLDSSLGLPPGVAMLVLKSMMESHDDHALVIGASYFGRFVIEGISENRRHHTGAGMCLVDEVSLKLLESKKGWA